MTKTKVGLIHNPDARNYEIKIPFNPPKTYKELEKFDFKTDSNNKIYDMIRELLKLLNMDKDHINTMGWNPFSEIIKNGDMVLIKPNFVKHFHPLGKKGVLSQITHASILRPIIDYVILALNGSGKVVIADTPLDKADFDKIIQINLTADLINFYKNDLGIKIDLYDLRSYKLVETRKGYDKKYTEKLMGPPGGFIKIDLKNQSELSELDNKYTDYYTLADSSIDKLDIINRKKGKTNNFHFLDKHIYKIPKIVLDSDVIISVPKLKTHKMAGVSLNLKNMIGICEKIYLPHHRRGNPPYGDAFQTYPSSSKILKRKMNSRLNILTKRLNPIIEKISYQDFYKKYFHMYYQKFRNNLNIKDDWWGSWYGNDTLWRTIYDLNKIILYSDKFGNMKKIRQRNYFNIIDGIIGQEGEGPMTGVPKSCGIIIGSLDPVASDTVASYIIGYDITKLKIINRAKTVKYYELGECELNNIEIVSNFKNPLDINLNFKLPKGYKDLSR